MSNIIYIYIIFYGILLTTHTLLQILFAQRNFRKHNFIGFGDSESDLSVTVIVPCYNEKPYLLDKCLDSIKRQRILGKLETIVVDDGSKNIKDLLPILNKYRKKPNFKIILFEKNKGKRFAQKAGYDRATGDIIVTVDSDTIIDFENGIAKILKYFKNPKVGAVTGDVKVFNKQDNLLTRLIFYRYWLAFNLERAAQSYFGTVMCCSGPFSAYRTSIIKKVKEKFVAQKFLGNLCTYGDDRHLTNLVLQDGHIVLFDKDTIAYTFVPNTLKGYIKQQIRWNKSFYRELIWTLKNIPNKHLYMVYDMFVQLLLPYMSLFALILTVYTALFISLKIALLIMLLLSSNSLIRIIYGIYKTQDLKYLIFVVYGFLHMIFLIPSRFYALLSLKENGWGTR